MGGKSGKLAVGCGWSAGCAALVAIACSCSSHSGPGLAGPDVVEGDSEWPDDGGDHAPLEAPEDGDAGVDDRADVSDESDMPGETDGADDADVPYEAAPCTGEPGRIESLGTAEPAAVLPLFSHRREVEPPWFGSAATVPVTVAGVGIDEFMARNPRGAGGARITDLDADDDLDMVLWNAEVILNQGDGTFVDGPPPVLAEESFQLDVGRFDGDSFPDLVVRSYSFYGDPDPPITIYLGHGDGSFRSPGVVVAPHSTMLRVFDADLDGDDDLLTGRLWLNDGAGAFADATDRIEGWYPDGMQIGCIGDVTGDGLPDLLGGPRDFGTGDRLWVAEASGRWVERPVTAVDAPCACADLGDVDGDGWLDELVGCSEMTWGWITRCMAADGYPPPTLRRNIGGDFTDALDEWLPRDRAAFLGGFIDVDADGDLDIGRFVNTRIDTRREDVAPPSVSLGWLTDGAIVAVPPAIVPFTEDGVSGVDFARFRVLLNGTDETAVFWDAMWGRLSEERMWMRPWRPSGERLVRGENLLRIEAWDLAGNGAAYEWRFLLDPAYPGLQLSLDAPDAVAAGEPAEFRVGVLNSGTPYDVAAPDGPFFGTFEVTSEAGSLMHRESVRLDPWCRSGYGLASGSCEADSTRIVWDGRDLAGTAVPPGSYLATFRGAAPYEAAEASERFIVR